MWCKVGVKKKFISPVTSSKPSRQIILIMTAKEYDNLPKEIKNIVDSWDDNKDLYSECDRIKKELEQKSWTCDYGLDGTLHNVVGRIINY